MGRVLGIYKRMLSEPHTTPAYTFHVRLTRIRLAHQHNIRLKTLNNIIFTTHLEGYFIRSLTDRLVVPGAYMRYIEYSKKALRAIHNLGISRRALEAEPTNQTNAIRALIQAEYGREHHISCAQ